MKSLMITALATSFAVGSILPMTAPVAEAKTKNIQLKGNTSRDEFIRFRSDRDKTLSAPKLLYPSIQVNIDAGRVPPKFKAPKVGASPK